MELLEETIGYTANGIVYNIPIMRKVIASESEYNEIQVKELKPTIDLPENIPQNAVNDLIKNMPIAIFTDDKNLNISIINNEAKLYIQDSVKDFSKTSILSSIFENILKANITNFHKLESIVISYTRNYNAGDEKLKLLNEEIEGINDWAKNKTFILSIPFDYDDYTVLYKIQKLLPSNINDKNRYYQVFASFNFELKVNDKQTQIKSILQQQNDGVFHSKFIQKAEEFMGLKYDRNNQ